jgi:predicted DNA-binding protein (UPF0251 family)
MALLDLSAAAKAAGVSRQTLYRKMAEGVVSWDVDHQGKRRIDTAELLRAFGPLHSHDENLNDVPNNTVRHNAETVEGYKIAIDTLKSQVESERQRASRAESEVDFLRSALTKAQDDVQKLLTHQRTEPEKQIRPWWKIW